MGSVVRAGPKVGGSVEKAVRAAGGAETVRFRAGGIFRQYGEAYGSAHALPLQLLRVMRGAEA